MHTMNIFVLPVAYLIQDTSSDVILTKPPGHLPHFLMFLWAKLATPIAVDLMTNNLDKVLFQMFNNLIT